MHNLSKILDVILTNLAYTLHNIPVVLVYSELNKYYYNNAYI